MGIETSSASGGVAAAGPRLDLFISYSSPDIERAHAIRVVLEASGYSCWMAPDDIVGTTAWAEQIADAVAGCRAMLVLVSQASVASRHVPKEAELAFGKTKPLIPVRLDDVVAHGSLEYLLSLEQWIDVFPGPLEAHAEDLLARVSLALAGAGAPRATTLAPQPSPTAARPITPPPLIRPRSGARKVRRLLFAAAALAAIIISILSFTQANATTLLQTQDLRINPNPAAAGTTATAIGRGWATGNPVEIQWDAAYGTVVGTGTSDANGTFSIGFTVPGGATPGNHQVWACQYARGTTCSPSNEFQVMVSTTLTVAADDPPVANPDGFTTTMGQPFLIPDADLIANDSDPNGDPLCTTVRVIDGPTRGSLNRVNDSTWIYAPNPGVFGSDSFTYRVCDQVNGAWSNTTRVSISVVFRGAISLSSRSGRPGTNVTVAGTGFVVDWQVRVSWENTRVATRRADGTGSFSAAFDVPEVAAGTYWVEACTVDTDACAAATFEVTPPPAPPPTTESPTTTTTTTTTAPTTTATTTTTAAPTTTEPPDGTTSSSTTMDPGDNVPPVVVDDIVVVEPDGAVLRVLSNDHDPDGSLDRTTLRIVEPPRFGSTELRGSAQIAYLPGHAFEGTDAFRYEVCDDQGACATALVTIRLAALPPCPAEGLTVESFSANPPEGEAGTGTNLTLGVDADALEGCYLAGVQFLWAGQPWGEPRGFSDDTVRASLTIPEGQAAGRHEITAAYLGTGVVLDTIEFTVVAPPAAAPGEPAPGGGSPWWPWLPIGAAVVVAGAWAARRRWRSPVRQQTALRASGRSAEIRARDLLSQMRTADIELEECEARHGTCAILPTGAAVGEGAGGTKPYLLEFENPYAPVTEEGVRGWFYPRRKEPIRGIVVHTTEGMALPGTTADRIARYFATTHRPASAHAIVDPRGCITLLPDEYTALHVPMANSASLGLVVCLPEDPEGQRTALEHAGRWCRSKADEYGFPVERTDAAAWNIGGFGVLGHADLDPAAADPVAPAGFAFPWEVLVDGSAGVSKFPAVVPVKRSPSADPCAELRRKAHQAHKAAAAASREAAEAAAALGE